MRIGLNFTPPHESPEQWAEILEDCGFRAASFPVDYRAPVGLIDAYTKAAREHDIRIAEVGVWDSPHLSDPQRAREAQTRCLEQFRLAEYIHADCCVNVSGAAGDQWFFCYRENYDEALYAKNVEFLQRLCDTVKPQHTVYALEPMQWMLPWNPRQYLKLLRDVDRKGCGVHMDIFNFVRDPYGYTHQEELMEEAFSLLGSSIASSHLKDILLTTGTTVRIQETPLGTGQGKLGAYLHHLSLLPKDTPVLLEHLDSLDEYRAAMAFLRQDYPQYVLP
ncbi:MAG: sugar phosphate isomerase/epimerase family protein [Acutalibacter sp.]